MKKQELKVIRNEMRKLHERLAHHLDVLPHVASGKAENDYFMLVKDSADRAFYDASSALHRLWVQAE